MSTLEELAREQTDLGVGEVDHIHRLLAWWQLIADLSFADLALWSHLRDREGFVCLGQMRPYTAQTLHPEDLFGTIVRPEELPVIERASREGRTWKRDDPVLINGVPVRVEATPVFFGGRFIAVMTKEGAPLTHRRPGQLEENYLECASALTSMVQEGTFPFGGEFLDQELLPRVGDGLVRLNRDGVILYASPNAVSAYRRLGFASAIQGRPLGAVGFDVGTAERVLSTGEPAEDDVEHEGTVVLQRVIPFLEGPAREVTGALLLLRDVTELRDRERMLQRKEAVIREIHHRVKNNLQTIASLLRIQARRLSSDEAKGELEEAVARIASIALVHETLSQDSGEWVQFGRVARQIVRMISESLTLPDRHVEFSFSGDPGYLPAEMATPLAVVLVELLQNAVEHAFEPARGGKVAVLTERHGSSLRLVVEDDGKGLPEEFTLEKAGLGLQIVKTLAQEELEGRIGLEGNGGTRVTVDLEVGRRRLAGPPRSAPQQDA